MTCTSNHFGLCEICHKINSLDSYQSVIDGIVNKITAELPCIDAAMIRIIDKKCERLEVAAHCGLSDAYIKKGDILLSESEVGRKVFIDGETIVATIAEEDKFKYFDYVTRENIQAIITAPLKTTTYSLGVLRGYSFKQTSFSEEEIETFKRLALQAAIAIETFKSLKRSKTLVEFSQKIISSTNLDDILQTTVVYASDILNLKGSSIRLYNANNHQMELMASWGLGEVFLATGYHSIDEMPIEKEVMNGKEIYIPEISKDPRFKRAEMAQQEGVVSVLCLPLSSSEKIFGTFRVYTAHKYFFSEDEINYLKTLANQTATAIQNAYQLKRLQKLSTVTSAMNKSLNKEEVFKKIVIGAAEATDSIGCALLTWNPRKTQLSLKSFHGNISEELLHLIQEYYVERSEKELYEEQVSFKNITNTMHIADKCKELDIGSIIRIPIISKERNLGLLICFVSGRRHGSSISESEIEFFRILANSAATALENMRLYEALTKKYNALVDDVFIYYDSFSRGME